MSNILNEATTSMDIYITNVNVVSLICQLHNTSESTILFLQKKLQKQFPKLQQKLPQNVWRYEDEIINDLKAQVEDFTQCAIY